MIIRAEEKDANRIKELNMKSRDEAIFDEINEQMPK